MTGSSNSAVLPRRRRRPPARRRRAAVGTLWRCAKIRSRPGPNSTFELPIIIGSTILGTIAVVSEPAAIKRFLVDNAANYAKDRLQRRVLGEGLQRRASARRGRGVAQAAPHAGAAVRAEGGGGFRRRHQ